MKVAIIFGITGQDGTILASQLINKGYKIIGITRSLSGISQVNFKKQVLNNKISFLEVIVPTIDNLINIIKLYNPNEIYNLTGQTSVANSFIYPLQTYESNINLTLNILEAIRLTFNEIKFFNSCSSDCFGNCLKPANEKTIFNPVSPYGLSKSIAYTYVKFYRDHYGLFAISGIFSNHDSEFRKSNFVTKKIIETAINIKKGKKIKLNLGDTSIKRDFGYAYDYCEAIHLMILAPRPKDYIIATGSSITLLEYIDKVFSFLDLKYEKYLIIDYSFFRKNEIKNTYLDPSSIKNDLGWKAKHNSFQTIELLIKHSLKAIS